MLLGGAALTRTYVERDLREVYEGRLFYGKDAFEGLSRSWTSSVRHEARPATTTRTGAGCRSGRDLPARRSSAGDDDEAGRPPRPLPDVAADNEVFVPPFVGAQVVKGLADRRHRRVHQRDRAVPQPVAVPARAGRRRRDDEEFKARIRPEPPRAAGQGQGVRRARAAARLRLLPGQQRRRRPRSMWTDEPRTTEADPVPLPAPAQGAVPVHRRLLPAGRRPTRSTTPRSTSSRWAARCQRGHGQAVRRRTSTNEYLLLHGLGVEMAEAARRAAGTTASAPSGASPPRTARRSAACSASSTGAAATRGATRPARTSRTTPRSLALLGGERIGLEVQRGHRLAVPARADHLGDHLPPPAGQVLRRRCPGRILNRPEGQFSSPDSWIEGIGSDRRWGLGGPGVVGAGEDVDEGPTPPAAAAWGPQRRRQVVDVG